MRECPSSSTGRAGACAQGRTAALAPAPRPLLALLEFKPAPCPCPCLEWPSQEEDAPSWRLDLSEIKNKYKGRYIRGASPRKKHGAHAHAHTSGGPAHGTKVFTMARLGRVSMRTSLVLCGAALVGLLAAQAGMAAAEANSTSARNTTCLAGSVLPDPLVCKEGRARHSRPARQRVARATEPTALRAPATTAPLHRVTGVGGRVESPLKVLVERGPANY